MTQLIEKIAKNIIISVSDVCGAGCVYCPSIRATSNKKDRIMSLMTFQKILNRILESNNADKVETFCLSGNGDCFLNTNILTFMRLIREKLPHVKIIIYSNFLNIDKYVEDMISENLIDYLGVNINTLNPKYNKLLSKGEDYAKTLNRLKNIITLRNKYKTMFKIEVFVLSLQKYISYCKIKTGKTPVKLSHKPIMKIKDDYKETYKLVKPLLTPLDAITKSFIFLWAEAKNIETPDYNHVCPNLYTFDSTLLINPNGDVHLCCYDSNYNLIYDNVFESSIEQIMNGKNKSKLVGLIKDKKYDEVGFPCTHVELCQRYRPTMRAKVLCGISDIANKFKN